MTDFNAMTQEMLVVDINMSMSMYLYSDETCNPVQLFVKIFLSPNRASFIPTNVDKKLSYWMILKDSLKF